MLRKTLRTTLIVFVLSIVGRPEARAATATASPVPPALELKKMISFPLAGTALPASSDALAAAIKRGLGDRVMLPAGAKVVHVQGGTYPSLEQLTVDLSNSTISSARKLPKLKPRGPIEKGVSAKEFRFIADPVRIDGAAIRLDIQATDVELGLQRDPSNQPMLILTSATDGQVRCDTTMRDLSAIFRQSAAARGKKYGLTVQRADLKLVSENERQLKASLRLASHLLFVPVALHLTANVEVNDRGEAHLSNLKCDGTDVAGWLISGFICPSMSKYNGKTIPLIAFPTEQIKLRDLRVRINGDDVHVNAAFGK